MAIQNKPFTIGVDDLEKVRRALVRSGRGPFFNLTSNGVPLTDTIKRVIKSANRKCLCCEAGIPKEKYNYGREPI